MTGYLPRFTYHSAILVVLDERVHTNTVIITTVIEKVAYLIISALVSAFP